MVKSKLLKDKRKLNDVNNYNAFILSKQTLRHFLIPFAEMAIFFHINISSKEATEIKYTDQSYAFS